MSRARSARSFTQIRGQPPLAADSTRAVCNSVHWARASKGLPRNCTRGNPASPRSARTSTVSPPVAPAPFEPQPEPPPIRTALAVVATACVLAGCAGVGAPQALPQAQALVAQALAHDNDQLWPQLADWLSVEHVAPLVGWLAHERCTDCHTDPHKGQFGKDCQSCHTVDGWNIINKKGEKTGFHDKTNFPLRGAHISVACEALACGSCPRA